jgi:small-conductance mechanosensitive channel
MGLGFKQIALVASALSVGIGFGLQQVVQNFVSGVILLVERPVKVGDWVNVGGLEGDIRSIRVRATEIQTFDRTTLIVPNSDLITKTVQNKTLGDPRGRIQLQVSIANPADARRAADLILNLAQARPEILHDPEPKVFIDSLTSGGAVNFNCYLYVDSPRDVYKTKSALYFDILALFIKEKVPFLGASAPQNIVVEPGPALQDLLGPAAIPPQR